MKRAVFLMTSAMVAFSAITSILMAEEPTWELSYIDRPKQFTDLTDRCLCVDSEGHPHIAYGGDHLYYAWKDGDGWHYEIAVEYPPTLGSHAAMALDRSGSPHISFYDFDHSTSGQLKYAYRDVAGWHVETIDGDDGTFTSIALDSCGLAHISYYDDEGKRLMYARRNPAGAWAIEVVDDRPYIVGRYSSLALDASGNPHIAYPRENIWWDLEYAYKDSAGWTVETVDVDGYAGLYASLALDQEGWPHISYYSHDGGLNNEHLSYAHRDHAGWHIETADGHGGVGTHTSIAVDNDGVPHISYHSGYGGPDSELRYARRDSAGWEHQIVDRNSSHGNYSSIGVHSDGTIHIAFCAGGDIIPGDLKYACRQGDTWTIDIVDHQGMTGYATSIALGGDSVPHVSYFRCVRTRPNWEYAVVCAQHGEDGWRPEVVEEGFGLPRSTSLAFDNSAIPHLAYASINRGVKYAWRGGTAWVVEAVAPSGQDASLALGRDGLPHIGFAVGYGDIGYASREADGWSIEIVEVEGGFAFAERVSLALDEYDQPHMAYYEAQNDDLRYACRDTEGWHTESVDTQWYTGNYPSIVVGRDGGPRIAYSGGYTLKYAHRTSTGWHTDVIEDNNGGYLGFCHISLALDAGGFPHITYQAEASGHLKYAYEDELGWHTQTVDAGWDIGQGADLALSSTGVPHISYCHTPNRDVKYATVAGVGAQINSPTPKDLTLRIEGPCPSAGITPFGLFLAKPSSVSVSVFDLGGRRVKIAAASPLPEGAHRLIWDGLDDCGLRVPSGTYVCSAEAGGVRASTRVVLIR